MSNQLLTGILFLLGMLVIIESTLLVILGARSRRFKQVVQEQRKELTRLHNEKLDPTPVLAAFIKRSNTLDDLMQFAYRFRQGKASLEEANDVIQSLLEDMRTVWGLRVTAELGSQVHYAPERFRSNSKVEIPRGAIVRVIESGWAVGDQVIKYPLVEWDGGN